MIEILKVDLLYADDDIRCDFCGRTIPKFHLYIKNTYRWNGEIVIRNMHEECAIDSCYNHLHRTH